jgi:hypothetical protein
MNTTPEDDFQIIAGFLDAFAVAAEGHARNVLSAEDEEALQKLARGELDDDERQPLVSLLAGNEVAMEYLVAQAG